MRFPEFVSNSNLNRKFSENFQPQNFKTEKGSFSQMLLLITLIALVLGGLFLYSSSLKEKSSPPKKAIRTEKNQTKETLSVSMKKKKETKRRTSSTTTKKKKKKKKKSKFLERNIPGFKRTVCADVSNDGQLIAVGNVENNVYVYSKTTLSSNSPRYHLLKDVQEITACSIHANNSLIVCASSKDNSLKFYVLPKIKSDFSQQKHFASHIGATRQGFCADIMTGHKTNAQISSVILASTGIKPFVVTCASGGGDTSVRFFNLRGKLLANVNSHQIDNRSLSIDPSSKFVAVSSLSSEIKIYAVHRDKKTGVFEKVSKAMSLNGHTHCVQAVRFGFHPHGRHRIVSGSNDGTISMWDTDVRSFFWREVCVYILGYHAQTQL